MQPKPFIVAEIGGNHHGSFQKALDLVFAAKEAGADAVKFQCFSPEQMAPEGVVIESGPWEGHTLRQLYEETHTPRDWFADLFRVARGFGLTPFASVFHPDDVDFLETLDCPIYKISSFEITDLPLIRYAAKTGKQIIISTGMATEDEICNAVVVANEEHTVMPTLLKCTSAYPSMPADANLGNMAHLKYITGSDVGLSDHSRRPAIAIAATALGASVIEAHLIMDRSEGGPDAAFSLDPGEFRAMVQGCRDAAAALGEVTFGPAESEASSLPFRRKPGGKRGE